MNKFKFYFILFSFVLVIFSCNNSDSSSSVAIRDFDVQYNTDKATIVDYLETHYLKVINSPGEVRDQDVIISLIDDGQLSIMTLLNAPEYPKLIKVPVVIDDTTYEMYYLQLRADNDSENAIKPSKADEVFTAYNGSYLAYVTTKEPVLDKNGDQVIGTDGKPVTIDVTKLKATQFEYVAFPQAYIRLDLSIRGWREIMPKFKPGNKLNVSGPIPYEKFGAGVLFIPSGLGYFNVPKQGIPAYSPLVFSFKLYDVKFGDQDGDGILSNDEDLSGEGDFTNDDTDGDGIQNLYDKDDDGDGYFTRTETKKPVGALGSSLYYPFNPILEDNPETPDVNEFEPLGVPNCAGDGTSPNRLRKYLDPTCH